MRPEPYIRCSEYCSGDGNFVWRQKWTVELDFASGEDADAFVELVKREGLLPKFKHGPRTEPGPTNRVKKRKAR